MKIVIPPVGLLITAVLWGGCSHLIPPPLEDLCAGHTVLEPDLAVVRYSQFEGHWRPSEQEIWALERKLQRFFINPSVQLGNISYSGKPPPRPSGFTIEDYFVSYKVYQENGQKLIKASGYIRTAGHAADWLKNEALRNTPYHEHPDGEVIYYLRPFGGGSSTFDALYNTDSGKLKKFHYGGPL